MQHIKSTEELTVGMVVLSGSFYFLVEGWSATHFSGPVWNMQSRQWGRRVDIPLPSPCHLAYAVENPLRLFPEE